MIKKNQFALIFLTIVTMLAVWYIKAPINTDKDDENQNDGETTAPVITDELERLEELMLMRDAIRNERSLAVVSLDAVLADENATLASKQAALKEKQALSALTEKEVLLELQVINSGYQDALVHATSTGIEVLVVSDENSASKANEIILMTLSSFENYDTVFVNFMTAEELKK